MADPVEYTGSFPVADAFAVACRVAGSLAEDGCRDLLLQIDTHPPRPLSVRETDLPGMLTALLCSPESRSDPAVAVTLSEPRTGLFVSLCRESSVIHWRTDSARVCGSISPARD